MERKLLQPVERLPHGGGGPKGEPFLPVVHDEHGLDISTLTLQAIDPMSDMNSLKPGTLIPTIAVLPSPVLQRKHIKTRVYLGRSVLMILS